MPQQGSKAVGLYRLAEPSQPGLLPTAKALHKLGVHLACAQEIFPFFLFLCRKGQERWKEAAHQIFSG